MNTVKILGLLFLAVTCMSNTFGSCSDDKHNDCEDSPACESTVLGTLMLDTTSALPFQGSETVTFVNQQGSQVHFKGRGYTNDTTEKYIVNNINVCKDCTEHYQKERSSLVFVGTNINFSYTYQRVKNTPEGTAPQGPVSGTIDDAIAIKLGNGDQ